MAFLVPAYRKLRRGDRPDVHFLERAFRYRRPARILGLVGLDEILEVLDDVRAQMLDVVAGLLFLGERPLYVLAVLVYVELRNAADLELEKPLHVVVDDVAPQLLPERLEPLDDGAAHALCRLLLFDALVDALLDADALQGPLVENVVELGEAYLEFAPDEEEKPLDVLAENLRNLHELRSAAVEDDRAGGYRLLAVGKRVERRHRLLLARAGLKLELDPDGLARQIVDFPDGDFFLLHGVLYRRRKGVGRFAPGKLRYHEFGLAVRLDLGPHLDAPEAVVVFARVHRAAELEVGEYLEGLLLDYSDFRLEKFDEIVREDRSRKPDRDSVRAEHEKKRYLRGKIHGLHLAAVVVGDEIRRLLVEDLVAGKLRQAALYVPSRGVGHPRVERAVVTLAVDEIPHPLAPELVGENDYRVAYRGVAVRMVLHRMADNVRDLGVAAVVLLPEGVHDAALDGLEAVLDGGDGARADDVGGILPEVEIVKLPHGAGARERRRGRRRRLLAALRGPGVPRREHVEIVEKTRRLRRPAILLCHIETFFRSARSAVRL